MADPRKLDVTNQAQEHGPAYGGRVGWQDFVLFPVPALVAGLPLLLSGPRWLAMGILGIAALWMLALACISTSALNAREWVGGARVQLPLIIFCLFFGEVLWFSSLYLMMSQNNPTAFNQAVDPITAVYFSLATITTTGFGDIHAKSQGAQLAVSAEMLCSVATIVVLLATAASKAFEQYEKPRIRIITHEKDE